VQFGSENDDNILGEIKLTRVNYEHHNVDPRTCKPCAPRRDAQNKLRVEVSSDRITKEALAKRAVELLEKKGIAIRDDDAGWVRSCVGDVDKDGFLDIDVSELMKHVEEHRKDGLEVTQAVVFEVLVRDPHLFRFFSDSNEDIESAASYRSLNLFSFQADLQAESPDHRPKFLIPAKHMNGLPTDHGVGDALMFFKEMYMFLSSEGGQEESLDIFNEWLNKYLYSYYIHISDSVPEIECNVYNVEAEIDENTRTTDFSVATTMTGRRKARVDCDIFAQIGFHILSGIRGNDKEKIFDVKIIGMYPEEDCFSHIVLIYTEKRSGRKFMLSNFIIYEIPKGISYKRYIFDHKGFEDFVEFDEYKNIGDYKRNPWNGRMFERE
jgi:hypothetical protein